MPSPWTRCASVSSAPRAPSTTTSTDGPDTCARSSRRGSGEATDRLIETGHADAPVEDRLRAVNRQASELRNARLERAIRGWAAREPEAREVQDRVDRRRLAFLEELCAERMGEGEAAKRLARVFQLAFVGAQHLDPPLEGDELYRTFRFLDPLFDMGGVR